MRMCVRVLAGAPPGKKQDKGKGKADAGPAKEYVFTAESQAIDPTSPAGVWVGVGSRWGRMRTYGQISGAHKSGWFSGLGVDSV